MLKGAARAGAEAGELAWNVVSGCKIQESNQRVDEKDELGTRESWRSGQKAGKSEEPEVGKDWKTRKNGKRRRARSSFIKKGWIIVGLIFP